MVAGIVIGDQPFFSAYRRETGPSRRASHHGDPGHHEKESTEGYDAVVR
jgi:hypothetical protein